MQITKAYLKRAKSKLLPFNTYLVYCIILKTLIIKNILIMICGLCTHSPLKLGGNRIVVRLISNMTVFELILIYLSNNRIQET